MSIKFERLSVDVEAVGSLVEEGHRVRDTPHMGGPYWGKYGLTLGGLATEVVVVDTTKAARDEFGKAGEVNGEQFISRNKGQLMIAAALNRVALSDADLQRFQTAINGLGIENASDFLVGESVVNLAGLHKYCLERTVAEGVSVETFAELWRGSGDSGTAMMEYMAKRGYLSRWYNSEAKKIVTIGEQDQYELLEREGRYFDERDGGIVHGLLPPVVAMFAIELVMAVREQRDVTYDHCYVSSAEYTEEAGFKEQVLDVTRGTLASLGLTGNTRHVLLISDNSTCDKLGGTKNHFERMMDGERFDAAKALSRMEKIEVMRA